MPPSPRVGNARRGAPGGSWPGGARRGASAASVMDRATTVAFAEALARGIELVGMGVMLIGGVAAIAAFVVRLARRPDRTGGSFEPTYRDLRANLGRAILLGLEFLVAADIIGTVAVAPSFSNLGVLGLIVVIRTFLSFSLELEISGRWPWQHRPAVTQAEASEPTSVA